MSLPSRRRPPLEASSPSVSGSTLLTHLVHGSTVATNAVLERKGARTAWVTSAGFRDILHIGRQQRRALYDLTPTVPAPLIPRESCFEIDERVAADGSILTPLSREEVVRLAQELVSIGVESVALLFLHSYEWPDHEKRLRRPAGRGAIGLPVARDSFPNTGSTSGEARPRSMRTSRRSSPGT